MCSYLNVVFHLMLMRFSITVLCNFISEIIGCMWKFLVEPGGGRRGGGDGGCFYKSLAYNIGRQIREFPEVVLEFRRLCETYR